MDMASKFKTFVLIVVKKAILISACSKSFVSSNVSCKAIKPGPTPRVPLAPRQSDIPATTRQGEGKIEK